MIYAQCVKHISTNPENPLNNELQLFWENNDLPYSVNPYLNNTNLFQYNAGVGFYNINLNSNVNWQMSNYQNNPSNLNMINPYSNDMGDNYMYLRRPINGNFVDRDFHWEDGWEMLWLGTGYFPNGDDYTEIDNIDGHPYQGMGVYQMASDKIPFFVLYNRYRGIIRIFANVFLDINDFDHMKVTLEFEGDPNSGNQTIVSGLLRHANSADLAMDHSTEVFSISSAKMHAPNDKAWFSADFQIGYDPCTCFNPSSLKFKIETFEEMDVRGKTVAFNTEVELEKFLSSDYMEKAFLNLENYDGTNTTGGSMIFQNYEGMFNSYKKKLDAYNAQGDKKSTLNDLLKIGLSVVSGYVTNGIASSIDYPLMLLFADSIKRSDDLEKKYETNIKGIIGKFIDYGSQQLGKGSPQPSLNRPTMPVANVTESYYQGTISSGVLRDIPALKTPGTYPNAHNGNFTELKGYPAYNEVLGLFSMLNTPSIKIYEKRNVESKDSFLVRNYYLSDEFGVTDSTYWADTLVRKGSFNYDLYLKLDKKLKYYLNPALDFDMEKTRFFGALKITLKGNIDNTLDIKLIDSSYFHTAHWFTKPSNINGIGGYVEDNEIVFETPYIDFEDLGEEFYGITLNDSVVKKWVRKSNFPTGFHSYKNSSDNIQFIQVELKVMADMYFNQVGWFGKQVNTTQNFTYVLYGNSNGKNVDNVSAYGSKINDKNEIYNYHPNTLKLEGHITPNSPYISDSDGSNLYIYASNIQVANNLTVENGYYVHAVAINNINFQPGASISPNIRFSINKILNFGGNPASDEEYVTSFCNDLENGYKGNNLNRKSTDLYASIKAKEAERVKKLNLFNKLRIYPNPATDVLYCEMKNYQNGNYNISVKNIIGHELYSRTVKVENNHLEMMDIKELAPGTYLITVSNRETGYIETEKVIVL